MATDRDDDGLMLPPLEERRWLIDQLAALIKARGPAPFLVGPLLEPSARFFPDRWAGGERSLRLLARRLLQYAGLGDRRLEVTIYDADPARRGEVGKPVSQRGHDLPVWLVALERDVLKIGAEGSHMADPHTIVAATARVVAHAFRRHHGLALGDAFDPRIDLTGVYLGFGLLTADAALRYTQRTATGAVQTRRVPARLGVLSAQAMSYLLAAQWHARGVPRAERQRLGKQLQANQAAFVRHGYAAIERLEPPIDVQLALPVRDQWPEPPPLEQFTAPFADEPADAAPEVPRGDDPGVVGVNVGKPVFRVERSMAARLGRTLGMGALMLGGVLGGMKTGLDIGPGLVPLIAIGLGVGGLVVGRFLRESRCSEPRCGAPLTPDARTCPRCGGDVVGTIGHPRERLAAEENWRRANALPEPEPDGPASPGT